MLNNYFCLGYVCSTCGAFISVEALAYALQRLVALYWGDYERPQSDETEAEQEGEVCEKQ